MLGYINNEIQIDFLKKMPDDYKTIITELEEADREENLAKYINALDALDNGGKMLCMNGVISYNEWQTLLNKYFN